MTSPVAEEAARLAEALQGWLTRVTAGAPLATGAPECVLCPVCQVVSAVRSTSPEVVEHLSAAALSVVAAVRAALEGARPAPTEAGSDPADAAARGDGRHDRWSPVVEHIPVVGA